VVFDIEFTYDRIEIVPRIPSEYGLSRNYFVHMVQGSLGAGMIYESHRVSSSFVFLFRLHSSPVLNSASGGKAVPLDQPVTSGTARS